MEIEGPIGRVVLQGPRLVPHGRAGKRDRPESRPRHPIAEFDIVVLDEEGHPQPNLADRIGRYEAAPPRVEGGVEDILESLLLEGDGLLTARGRTPPHGVRLDPLRTGVQDGWLRTVEHVAAHRDRMLGEGSEDHGSPQPLGLHHDIVVQEHHERRFAVVRGLKHPTGETP